MENIREFSIQALERENVFILDLKAAIVDLAVFCFFSYGLKFTGFCF